MLIAPTSKDELLPPKIEILDRPRTPIRFDDSEIPTTKVYDIVKLVKTTEIRTSNKKAFTALKQVQGLEPIEERSQFKPSIFTSLISSKGEETKCKFLIVVAMYNESAEHFVNTMTGVNDNLKYFAEKGIDIEEIACIVIVDGIRPFLETYNREKIFFSQFFDEDQVKEKFQVDDMKNCKIPNQGEMDEFAHIFSQQVTFGGNSLPLQLIMCVKQFNKRKLNTHLWFFGGFCELLNPEYVMLLDVGTKPLEGSLYYLYEAMHLYPQIAGCCGEIQPLAPSFWKLVVGAQLVEYKFSHMLDKAFESVLGFITVLPGAFSAYRWSALNGSPLWTDYFKSLCHPELMDAFNSNIYLAEDRVLCLSLFTKRDCNYVLRYVKKSVAETDVPDNLSELMAQRRRWVNGSWFALIDSLVKCKRINNSSHSFCRKFMFTLQMLYYLVNVLFTWFIVGLYCIAISLAIRRNYKSYGGAHLSNLGDVLTTLYVAILIVLFIISLGVKPKRVEEFYKFICYFLGLYQFYFMYLVIKLLFDAGGGIIVLIGALVLVGGFASIVVLNCQILSILKGAIHYIFMMPTYVNIFLIYSICNIHDCTWGNRPDSLSTEERDRLEEFEEFRTKWAIIWVLCNSGLAYIVMDISDTSRKNSTSLYFFYTIAIIGAVLLIFRVLGGVTYFFTECCKKSLKESYEVREPAFNRATTHIVFSKAYS